MFKPSPKFLASEEKAISVTRDSTPVNPSSTVLDKLHALRVRAKGEEQRSKR